MGEYTDILNYYGEDLQTLKAIERLNDLSYVLLKDLDKEKYSRRKVLDCIAEVKVSLEQVLRVYGVSGKEIATKEHLILHKTMKEIKKGQKGIEV